MLSAHTTRADCKRVILGYLRLEHFELRVKRTRANSHLFNLARVDCDKQPDDRGRVSLECKVTMAVLYAHSGKPDTDNPNCSLDLDFSTYSMKELQKGVLSGITETAACINTMLTIDRNTKRVYLSFTKTKDADKFDKIRPGTCGSLPLTEVLMNAKTDRHHRVTVISVAPATSNFWKVQPCGLSPRSNLFC
jgi:hypothetical protein